MEGISELPVIGPSAPLSHQLNCESSKLKTKSQAIWRHKSQLWGLLFYFLFIDWRLEKETSSGWYLLKAKQTWWMVSKEVLPNLDPQFFYELHGYQGWIGWGFLGKLVWEVAAQGSGIRMRWSWTCLCRCERHSWQQPHKDTALALVSQYQHREQHFNTLQSHICSFFQSRPQ